jgi:hypothetical protein
VHRLASRTGQSRPEVRAGPVKRRLATRADTVLFFLHKTDGGKRSALASDSEQRRTMLRFSKAKAVAPQKRQAMMVRQASCYRKQQAGNWRSRRRLRVRARLGLLLRLRVRLSGLLGLLLRGVEELGCRAPRWSSAAASRARAPAPRCHGRRFASDQSSFYADAIADCLEFIKSRSSCLEN